jgi:hypothetical protein
MLPVSLASFAAAPSALAPSAATKHSPVAVVDIPNDWYLVGMRREDPVLKMYIGGIKAMSYSTKDHDSHHAHFRVWGKFAFDKPQSVGGKSYVTELTGIYIDCNNWTFAQFSDIRFDDKDNIVTESQKVTKFMPIHLKDDVVIIDMKPTDATAKAATSDTCGRDSD